MASRPQPRREETSGEAYLKMLANPVRAKIMLILEHGRPGTAAELAAEIGAPLRTVRYHLGVLRKGGFVAVERRTARRNVYEYSFLETTFGEVDVATYAALSPAERRALTNHYLQVIARGVTRFVAAGTTYDEHFPLTWRLKIPLDEEGWVRLHAILFSAIDAAMELQREYVSRLEAGEALTSEAEIDFIALEVPRAGDDA